MYDYSPSEISADVAVIGAGISGLTAAYRLARHGAEPVVLEAGDRVGGRAWNVPLVPGKVTEAGAMYVCDGQDDILELSRELGIGLFTSFKEGMGIAFLQGERHVFAGALPTLPPGVLQEWGQALRDLERVGGSLSPAAPWSHPDAERLDRLTLADWRDEAMKTPLARGLFDCSVAAWFATPPAEISFLYALHAVATCGGIKPLLRAQQEVFRFTGGSQALPNAMAERLAGRVHVGTPVREIDQTDQGEVVVHADGLRLRARQVIVAVNAAGARMIRFRPALPSSRQALADGWEQGPLIKTNVVYEEPFWRHEGLSGSGFTDLGPAPGFLDASPPDGSPGVLAFTAFAFPETEFRGNPEAFYSDPAVRRESTLRALASCFGPRALRAEKYLETDWRREPYIFGCQGALRPHALTVVREALHSPVGRVHWAGTETAERWTGWMNGAVQAGDRCAREVLDAL